MNEPTDDSGPKPPDDPRLRRDWAPPQPKPDQEPVLGLSTGCLFAMGFAGLVFGLCVIGGR